MITYLKTASRRAETGQTDVRADVEAMLAEIGQFETLCQQELTRRNGR